MKNIRNKLESFSIVLFGNRITAASFPLIIYGASTWAHGLQKALSSSEKITPNIIGETLYGYALLAMGVLSLGITKFGVGTLDHYRRTKKHIEQFGRLDKRFVKRVIDASENRKLVGYCQLQGVYLAAKKYGEIETFRTAKSEYSNVTLPNI